MSLFSVQARKHTAYYDNLVLKSVSKTPGRERKATDPTLTKGELTSGASVCDRRSSGKGRQGNRTYVVSAASKSGSGQQTPYRGRLTLQRRSRRKTGADTAEKTMAESSHDTTPAPEKRLTLQRRTRAPSMDKSVYGHRGVSGTDPKPTTKVLGEPNGRTPVLFRSTSLKETAYGSKGRETSTRVETHGRPAPAVASSYSTGRHPEERAHSFKTPTRKTPFEKIAAKREVFERLAGKEAPRAAAAVKATNLGRPTPQAQHAEDAKPIAAPRVSKASAGVHKPNACLQVKKTSTPGQRGDGTQSSTSTAAPDPLEQPLSRSSEAGKQQDSLKMENSAVTVAVRVRPFNTRCVMESQ